MDRKKLIVIDKTLGHSSVEKILKEKRGLYIYYNKPNRKTKILKIHKHFCGECAWGSGKFPGKKVGKNGVWIGPFSNEKNVETFITNNLAELKNKIERCSCLDIPNN